MYRYRVNKLLEIERIRASIATDLHDDIGSTLTEIALFSDVALRELHDHAKHPDAVRDDRKVQGYLEEIGMTSRGLIDAMNDIVWSIDPRNDTFDFLLLRMKTHAVRMLEAKQINYEIDIPSHLSALQLPLGFRRRLFLVYKEAINNVVRHAKASKVRLTMGRRGRTIVMAIIDDGCGFEASRPGTGNGLRNMQQRAASLGGNLLVESARGRGTTITLEVPIP